MKSLAIPLLRPRLITFVTCITSILFVSTAHASVFNGGGLLDGINALTGIGGIAPSTSITELLMSLITFVLNLVLIVAVAAIIYAGILLIVSGGDEAQKDKAKKIVLYAVIGIIVILFARVIVLFVNGIFS